jgi:uncharacterized protein YndB with AHSA1/START domain
MGHRFEIAKDFEVDATPEQVWEAIATGPGLNSWFLGKNEIEPREGGKVSFSVGGYTAESTVTAWEPPTRFVSTGVPGPDGSFHQFEYRIDGRGPGRSAIRYEHTGMLGEDWEAEYEAMNQGDPMYLFKLAEYLSHFQGRFAASIEAMGPRVPNAEQALTAFRRALEVSPDAAEGDPVRATPRGLPPIEGVIDYVAPNFLGFRSSDAIYRFIYGFDGTVMVGHHLFSEGVDQAATESAWRAWLSEVFDPLARGANPSG